MAARGQIRRVWRFLTQVHKEYTRDSCPLMAAAISFYALISLIPLALIGLSAFGLILGNDRAFQAVFEFLEQFLPRTVGRDTLRAYLEEGLRRPAGVAGILGVASLVWTASAGFGTVARALDLAWKVNHRHGFVASRLRSLAMMLVVGVLGLLSFSMTSAIRIVQEYQIPWLGWRPGEFPLVWRMVGCGLPLAMSVGTFVLCYVVLPSASIGWRPVLVGGLVGGILWELTKQGFAIYIAKFANYNMIYGSLGGLIVLVVWIYYSAAILLFGGEVASVSAEWAAQAPETLPREDG